MFQIDYELAVGASVS